MKVECTLCKQQFEEGDTTEIIDHLMEDHPDTAYRALEDVVDDYFVWAQRDKKVKEAK